MSPEPELIDGEESPVIDEGIAEAPFSPAEPVVIKPRSNIYTLLLFISLMFIILSIYLIGWELRNFYDANFGILSPKEEESIGEEPKKGPHEEPPPSIDTSTKTEEPKKE